MTDLEKALEPHVTSFTDWWFTHREIMNQLQISKKNAKFIFKAGSDSAIDGFLKAINDPKVMKLAQ